MIDLGAGIAIAGLAVAAAPVAITAIRVKSNSNSNGKVDKVCPLHSGIETSLEYLKQGQERIEEKLDKVIGG